MQINILMDGKANIHIDGRTKIGAEEQMDRGTDGQRDKYTSQQICGLTYRHTYVMLNIFQDILDFSATGDTSGRDFMPQGSPWIVLV